MTFKYIKEFLLTITISVVGLLFAGCLGTFKCSVFHLDTSPPEMIYAKTELQKAKNDGNRPVVLPAGSTIVTNSEGNAVGFILPAETWSSLLNVAGAIKGEMDLLSFETSIKTEDPQVVRRQISESDNQTSTIEYRSFGVSSPSQTWPPAYETTGAQCGK